MHENWKTYRLGDIATFGYGKMPKKTLLETGNIPIYSGYRIVGNYSKSNCKKGDVIVVARGVGGTGDVKLSPIDCFLTNISIKINFDNTICDNKYFYYKYLINTLSHLNTGSAQSQITIGDLERLEFNLPPLPEQKAIASILSAIDDKIENNLAMNKTLEDMAMALYKHWFVDFGQELENTLADYVNLNPRLSIKKGELASYVNMKALPTEGMSVSEVDKVVVKGGAKFQNGDTLLARITPCLENGKTAFVDFLDENEIGFGSTEFLVLRAKEGISKYWVYCLSRDTNLVNHAVSCMIGTSGRQRVQNNPFLQYELPEINKETMVSFEKKVEPWFKKVKANTNENQTLTKLRDTKLPKLISGEVRLKEFEEEITAAL